MNRLSFHDLSGATPRRQRLRCIDPRLVLAVPVLSLGLIVAANAGDLTPPPPTTSGDTVVAAPLQGSQSAHSLRIIAFGSSSTEGVGASSPAGAYPAQLERDLTQAMPKLTVEVVNRGIGGEDADDMVARLPSDVLARKPDLVIWQTGSNDPLRNVPLDRFEADTRAGIAAIRAAGASVMLMEPQWCPKLDGTMGAGRFRDAIRKIGAELNVPVIRRTDLMHRWVDEGRISRDQMIAPDGLHMTDRGYALLARDVAAEIVAGAASLGTKTRGLVPAPAVIASVPARAP